MVKCQLEAELNPMARAYCECPSTGSYSSFSYQAESKQLSPHGAYGCSLEGMVCKLGCLVKKGEPESWTQEFSIPHSCCVSLKLLLVSCIGQCVVSIPVSLYSVERTEVGFVFLDEGGCCIWLAQCGGCAQRNLS